MPRRKPPRKRAPARRGRPQKVTDEAILAAVLAAPTPTQAAARLGVSAETVRARLKDPELRAAIREHRLQALEAATARLAEYTGQAVETLVELMADSGPEDSVRLAAAGRVLEMAAKAAQLDREKSNEDRPEWGPAPGGFPVRLIDGGKKGDNPPAPVVPLGSKETA